MNEYLSDIYYNPAHPASYGSPHSLFKQAREDGKNYTFANIKKWLESQEPYTLFKSVKRNFKRPQVVVSDKFYQYDLDTANMVKWSKANKGFAYFLVIIDIFTRFAWTYPLQTLTGKEVVVKLKDVFSEHKCKVLRTDGGSEFNNRWVKQYLQDEHVKHVTTRNETKANFSERLIKTLKTKLVKHMYKNQTQKWFSSLAEVTHSYNNSVHRSIKTTPYKAIYMNKVDLWHVQYGPKRKKNRTINPKPPKFSSSNFRYNPGDVVRLAKFKTPFTKAYNENWTHELFIITDRNSQQGIAQYSVKGWDNQPVQGRFFTEELEKVRVNQNTTYMIEKVIKKKKINGKEGFIVRWLGWPARYDSWVSKTDIKEINRV